MPGEEGAATPFLSGDRRDQAFLAASALAAGAALALATAVAGRRGATAVGRGWAAGALVLVTPGVASVGSPVTSWVPPAWPAKPQDW